MLAGPKKKPSIKSIQQDFDGAMKLPVIPGEAEFKEQRSRQVAEEQGWCGMTQIFWYNMISNMNIIVDDMIWFNFI